MALRSFWFRVWSDVLTMKWNPALSTWACHTKVSSASEETVKEGRVIYSHFGLAIAPPMKGPGEIIQIQDVDRCGQEFLMSSTQEPKGAARLEFRIPGLVCIMRRSWASAKGLACDTGSQVST